MGMGFQFEVIKNVLETDGDDSCTAMWCTLTSENCTLVY